MAENFMRRAKAEKKREEVPKDFEENLY